MLCHIHAARKMVLSYFLFFNTFQFRCGLIQSMYMDQNVGRSQFLLMEEIISTMMINTCYSDNLNDCLAQGFPGGSVGNESTCSAGDLGLIPGSGKSPGEGHGNPLQYFCLENSMDRGAWQAPVHGVTKNQTQLSDTHISNHFI